MRRALLELTVDGVETSRDFHLRMMSNEDYRRGDVEIQWLERTLPSLAAATPPMEARRAAAIAAALFAERDRGTRRTSAGTAAGTSSPNAPTNGEQAAWAALARREGLRGW
jgi:acetyl-CoA carboxylase biotin carboxylase subunit